MCRLEAVSQLSRRVLRYSEDPDLPPKNPGLRSTSEPGVDGNLEF
jgi:hypothetical protein